MKQNKFGLIGAFIAAAAVMALRPSGAKSEFDKPHKKSWRGEGGWKPHQGDRERARRRRQIERGQLKAENGLARGA